MFTNKYRYFFILVLTVYSFGNSLFSDVYAHYNIHAPGYVLFAVFFFITLFVWEGNRLLGYRLEKVLVAHNPIRRMVIFFILGIFLSALISVIVLYFFASVLLGIPKSELAMPAILCFTYGTRINLFLHILNAVFFYMSQYKSKELEAEELKRINTQAQLQAIKNQINPHFLFNNLNVLSSMVMQENPHANQFIEEFSKVYRHVLNSQQKELIPLKDELEFVKPYLFLLEKRFPESIFVDIDISHKYHDYYIIPISVQMLIENAIKHNIASRSKPLHIEIRSEENDLLSVSNNLQLKSVGEPSTHIGLNNISQRYEIITGRKIEVKKTESQFIVLIPLIQKGL